VVGRGEPSNEETRKKKNEMKTPRDSVAKMSDVKLSDGRPEGLRRGDRVVLLSF